ncbi:MAG: hypothetical protein ACOYN4_11640 [Bacteroidales bacterium]
MTELKIEKAIIISFIGLIVAFLIGLGGNVVLKAGLPFSAKRTEVDFEKRLKSLENSLVDGSITRREYDSISEKISLQVDRTAVSNEANDKLEGMPNWVIQLGIDQPNGMKFDPTFSDYTSVDSPSEGFNSVSLVYTGPYEVAVIEAQKIAESASLSPATLLKSKGRPVSIKATKVNPEVSYLNYSLGNTDKDYLISVQVMPSGRLTIMVTDRKQLNERLLVYEPLNSRKNSTANQKKM